MSFSRPTYDPPYESPCENSFAWAIVKYLAPESTFEKQFAVTTQAGNFRLDFLVVAPAGTRIGIECDGREFHDFNRDEWRDAVILGERHVDEIIRFRASDIFHRLDDCLLILARLHPAAFSSRGVRNLETLSSDEAKTKEVGTSPTIFVWYSEQEKAVGTLQVERRSRNQDRGEFWENYYEYACAHPGMRLDELIAQYAVERAAAIEAMRSKV